MPLPCHKGLSYILVGKLLRKKIPSGAREVYNAFVKSEHVRQVADDRKKTRGRKVLTTSQGAVYDLEQIFDEVNARYFANSVPKPSLTWSARKTYRILGHHDATHEHISVSRSLDHHNVPKYVVEYIVFHEMLHIVHPTRLLNGRRYNHTPEFKRDERKFARFEEAERWIERNVRRLKRESKRP
jgi:predicted metal-dependent hydrolase